MNIEPDGSPHPTPKTPLDSTATNDSISENGEIVNGNISDLQDDGIINLAKERTHYDMDYSSENGWVDEEKTEFAECIGGDGRSYFAVKCK